jgi:hypothetical protein
MVADACGSTFRRARIEELQRQQRDTRRLCVPEKAFNRTTNPSPLGLSKQHPGPPERRSKTPEDGPVVIENFDDGWPGYEEPVII